MTACVLVGDNGAVLHPPRSGSSTSHGPAPSKLLLKVLTSRGMLSRQVWDVFGDCKLALEMHAWERRVRHQHEPVAMSAFVAPIRGGYELTPKDDSLSGGAAR